MTLKQLYVSNSSVNVDFYVNIESTGRMSFQYFKENIWLNDWMEGKIFCFFHEQNAMNKQFGKVSKAMILNEVCIIATNT